MLIVHRSLVTSVCFTTNPPIRTIFLIVETQPSPALYAICLPRRQKRKKKSISIPANRVHTTTIRRSWSRYSSTQLRRRQLQPVYRRITFASLYSAPLNKFLSIETFSPPPHPNHSTPLPFQDKNLNIKFTTNSWRASERSSLPP